MTYDLIIGHGTTIVDSREGLVTPLGGSTILKVGPQMLRNGSTPYHGELQYLALLQELVDKHEADPTPREDRTGTGTFSVFGRQIRFDLTKDFPLLTTKNVWWKGVVAELLWMLSGSTNINDLDARIWNEWADENGDLGPVYGAQWRRWKTGRFDEVKGETAFMGVDYTECTPVVVDQISAVLDSLHEKPNDRGHIVSAWNVGELADMALRPCHCLFQFYVEDGKLSCQLYQRSADIFLGVPFNIASYALLTHLIARELDLEVGDFVHTFGDLHLYANHVEQAKEQLSRTPRPFPTIEIPNHGNNRAKPSLFEIKPENITLTGYDPHPTIKAEVSV